MSLARELLICALLLGGSFLMVVTGYGLLKFPDVFCRGHAQTKAMTLGVCAMLLALWLHLDTAKAGWVLTAAILAQVITIPVGQSSVTGPAAPTLSKPYRYSPSRIEVCHSLRNTLFGPWDDQTSATANRPPLGVSDRSALP